MSYLIYNLSYKGNRLDFTSHTKDHKQAIFDAISTIFSEMEITSRDCGHISRYQLSTERDLGLMAVIIPDIKLELVETISGDEETQLDWALKLIPEFDRLKNSDGVLLGYDQELAVELSQNDFGIRKLLNRRFSSTYHHETQKIKSECKDELDGVLHRCWLFINKVESLVPKAVKHEQS